MQLSQPDTWQQQWRQKQRQFGLKFSLQSDSAISQIFFLFLFCFSLLTTNPRKGNHIWAIPDEINKYKSRQTHKHIRTADLCTCVCVCACVYAITIQTLFLFFFRLPFFNFLYCPRLWKKLTIYVWEMLIFTNTHIYMYVCARMCVVHMLVWTA